jgi:hypothetical protein
MGAGNSAGVYNIGPVGAYDGDVDIEVIGCAEPETGSGVGEGACGGGEGRIGVTRL